MISEYMDCIYLDRSEFDSTKWVKILGYILCSGVAKCLGKVWQHGHHWAASLTVLLPCASLSFYFFFLPCCQEHVLDLKDSIRNNSLQLERSHYYFSWRIWIPQRCHVQQIWKNTAKIHTVSQPHRGGLFSISSNFTQFQLSAYLRNRWGQWPPEQLYNFRSSMQNKNVGPLPRKY